jgi:hypothetical protein
MAGVLVRCGEITILFLYSWDILGVFKGGGVVMSSLESKFHADMINIYLTAKKELDYNAARFSQLVSQRGGLGVRHMGLRFF